MHLFNLLLEIVCSQFVPITVQDSLSPCFSILALEYLISILSLQYLMFNLLFQAFFLLFGKGQSSVLASCFVGKRKTEAEMEPMHIECDLKKSPFWDNGTSCDICNC